MGLLRLNRLNRLFLLALTVGIVAVAVRRPTLGPLAELPDDTLRYAALAGVWAVGTGLVLFWQRTLWLAMGSGAGYRSGGGIGPLFRLPTLRSTVREHTVYAKPYREGWNPLAGMRVTTALDVRETDVRLELDVTGASDPDGRVLFESTDGDRRYVLQEGAGDLEALFSTDFKAELIDLDVPGTITVEDKHVHYTVPYIPFDAGRLSAVTTGTVRMAEQAEAASGDTRRI